MKSIPTLILSIALASSIPAQTQILRGKVEDVKQTQNQFYLDGTTIPVISSTLDLNAWVGVQAILQVVNVGGNGNPVLSVRSAVATTKIMDMGNLRFGRSERWQVAWTPGSQAAVFAMPTVATSYAPLGAMGTWLLGPLAVPMAAGKVNNVGQFEFSFTMPTVPSLVGVSFSSQAAVQAPNGALTLSNLDAKEVRSN